MASWLTRLTDKITPWDRGGERKRREEEEQRRNRPVRPSSSSGLSVSVAAPQQRITTPQMPKTRQPENVFGTLDSSLFAKPKSTLDTLKEQKPVEVPKPGMVVRPTNQTQRITGVTTAPDAEIRIGNETVRRTPGAEVEKKDQNTVARNTSLARKIVSTPLLSSARVGTGLVQGTAGLYDLLTPGKGQNRLTQASTRHAETLDDKAKELGINAAYKGLNVPLEVLTYFAGAPTKAATKTPKVLQGARNLINRVGTGTKGRRIATQALEELIDPQNIAQEARLTGRYTGQDSARGEEITPGYIAQNAALSLLGTSLPALVRNLRPGRNAGVRRGVDEVEAGIGTAAAGEAVTPSRRIPVVDVQDIPITQVDGEVPINVRRTTPEGPLIRELGGDVPTPTRVPSPTDAAEQRATRRFTEQDWGIPDQRIEGTMPLTRGDISDTRATLDDLVNTKQISEDEFVQLSKELDNIENPPKGQPIAVREENTIPVRPGETVVPVNTPETPGTVRATAQRAPTQEVSEAVARESVPMVPAEAPSATALPNVPEAAARVPNTAEGDLNKVFEDVIAGLKENQKAYGVEKKMKASEFKRRKANYDRIYNEARAAGKSSQEAEAMATKALGGKYARNTVGNVEISQSNRDMLFDKVAKSKDNLNTKKAFTHLFDPNRTEPLRDWERSRIRRFLNDTVGEDAAQSIEEALITSEQSGDRSMFGKVADFMTSAIAAGDVSAAGRQGLSGWINHPKMSKQAWDDGLKALLNPENEQAFVQKLINDPDTAFIQENMGGKYLSLSDVADEARGGDTTSKAISWYVDPSNRHYNVYLDSLRHQQKKAILDRYGGQEGFLKAAQAANPENPEKWMKAWNTVIDRQSGRGNIGKSGSPTAGDIQVLFSARNLASKFQRLTAPAQLGLLKTNPDAYLYQLKESGTQAAALGATLAALGASGLVDIENGKIKVGNTRVDITGGFSTIFKAANDLYKSVAGQNEGGFSRSGGEVVTDFLRNQLSPILGTAGKILDIDFSEGKDKYGNEVNAGWFLKNAPMPAVAQTVVDSLSEGENPLETARNVFLDAIGFNTNTYMSAEDKDNAARGETADKVGAELQGLRDSGLLNDDIMRILPENVQKVMASGKPLKENELKDVKEVLVKGVGTGLGADSDSTYRERGNYDQDLAALQLKKQLLESDPRSKPSDLKNLDTQIKRSEVLRDNQIPYEDFKLYQTIGVDEWRKMGIPPGDKNHDPDLYDPEFYERLWQMDKLFTGNSGSYGKSVDKQKYSIKKSTSGAGGGGRSSGSSEFGMLKDAVNAPKAREYDTRSMQGLANMPLIRVQRPNIRHEIRVQ